MLWKRLTGWLSNLKLVPKLALTYALAIVLCAASLSALYLSVGRDLSSKQSDMLMEKNLQQAKSSIAYQLDLFVKVSDVLYNNLNLQDLLFREYYDALSRASAMNEILTYLTPISETLTNVSEFSLYAYNQTIPEHKDILKRLDSIREESWFQKMDPYYDGVVWTMTKQRVLDTSGSSMGPVTGVVVREIPKISMLRNVRNLSVSAFQANYLGVIKVDVDPAVFFQSLASTDSNQVMLVLDDQGQILYQQGSATAVPSILSGLRADLNTPNGDAKHIMADNHGWVVRDDWIEPVHWQVVYGISTEEYDRELIVLVRISILVTLAIMALIIFISWIIARGLTQKIRRLADSMKRLEQGDFDHVAEDSGHDEIGTLVHGYNTMTTQLKQLIEESYHNRIREKEHELQLLQAHINPHFLYNTLASIGWIGRRNGIEEIADITNALVRFYKSAMSRGGNLIPIDQELEHVKAYIAIQQFRFRDRIKVCYHIDASLLTDKTLRFVLQPFVENALLHGMYAKKRSITLGIHLLTREGMLVWKVIDDGAGMDLSKIHDSGNGSGYGVNGVDQRIKLLHGEPYGVTVTSRPGIGTSVCIQLPWVPDEQLANLDTIPTDGV